MLTTAPCPHRCICQEIYPPQAPPSNPLPLPPSAPPLACQAACGAGTCALYQGVNCSVLRSPPLSCSCGDCCVQPRFDYYACDVPCAGATCGAFASKLTCAASTSLGCTCNGAGLGYPNPGCCVHELTAVLDPTDNDRDAANSATNTALIQSVAAAAAAATSAAAAATAAQCRQLALERRALVPGRPTMGPLARRGRSRPRRRHRTRTDLLGQGDRDGSPPEPIARAPEPHPQRVPHDKQLHRTPGQQARRPERRHSGERPAVTKPTFVGL